MASHFSICAWKIPLMVWKGKTYDIGRWPPRSGDLQYATEEEQRAINNGFRKNKAAGSKWKWCSAVDVSGSESKVWWSKEQYCTGIWNVRSMNQVFWMCSTQETAKVNILGISELKWMGMGEFNTDDHYTYHSVRQESLRRNTVALIVNKRVWNTVLGCNLNNLDSFPRQTIQHHSNSSLFPNHQCWRSWCWPDLGRSTRPFRTSTKKRCVFHQRGIECKRRKWRDTWSNRQLRPWNIKWSRAKAKRVWSR